MRISTELINHWKFVRLCSSMSFARQMSNVRVPTLTITV
jgi:hypothetical protein